MNVYIVLIEDRHTDAAVLAFTTAEEAEAYARDYLDENADEEDVEESVVPGWLFYATYSVEGDSIRVERVPLQGEPVAT